jgi:hypothetical protein
MTERPILFSAPLVRALLAGTKTQTRRLVKPQPEAMEPKLEALLPEAWASGFVDVKCPFGVVGDRLWVRERWWHHKSAELEQAGFAGGTITHLDSGPTGFHENAEFDPAKYPKVWRCRPSIHMPRWASRLTLEITDVRVERLQSISEEDARAEGVEPFDCIGAEQRIDDTPRCQGTHPHTVAFASLWDSLASDDSLWRSNPWAWALSFKRVEAGHG